VSTQAITSAQATSQDMPTISISEGDCDPHGIFRSHRASTPFLRQTNGGYTAFIAIRVCDKAKYALLVTFWILRGGCSGRQRILQPTRVLEDVYDCSLDAQVRGLHCKQGDDPTAPRFILTKVRMITCSLHPSRPTSLISPMIEVYDDVQSSR
jgi:hypothetical protein